MNHLEKKVTEHIEQHKTELYSTLSELIKFDSQNFITHGREKACQLHIARLYQDIGLETEVYSPDSVVGIQEHPGYLAGRGMEDRPNVTGINHSEEKSTRVMLAAHTDTMPVGDPAKWTVDPFGGVIQDGRIYGLGASDNKSGIAAGYFALKALQNCGIKLAKTVLLTAYTDEEYGGGDGALAACLKYPCETFVNLDGGNYEVWIAALGGGGFAIEVKADFSTDTAAPAVDALYLVKNEIETMGKRRQDELHHNHIYNGSDMERAAFRLMDFNCGSFGSNLDSGKLTFVIYTDKSKAEINEELVELLSKINTKLHEYGFTASGFRPVTRFFDYLETSAEEPVARIMAQAAGEAAGEAVGSHPVMQSGACLSDLSIFLKYGSRSSISFGIIKDFSLPGGAHQPNEYVSCPEFLAYTQAIALFLIRYCGIAE
ncbi:MAG: M20/M25/M40 family metallo-hydrolase [Bacillota bacterium]|nr:M20/M25/M40 family metallo-hydrolase [Bacillota bacterium]